MSENTTEEESQARRSGTVSKSKQADCRVVLLQKILQMQYFQIAARRQLGGESVGTNSESFSEDTAVARGGGFKLFTVLLVLALGAGAYMLRQDGPAPAVEAAVSLDVAKAGRLAHCPLTREIRLRLPPSRLQPIRALRL